MIENYNPDVLTCLANLSNDEVFTPPELVNDILNLLPQKLFENKETTFLDPVCKSGVFLREIAKRLMKGLEKKIPDKQKRINHIFKNQLFGIAITELTSLLSRRSVYCSKSANGKYSICEEFDDMQGNIIYKRINHKWKNGKCKFCGASKKTYSRSKDLETHAYQFIHTEKPKELFKMKFDVIIGNPPYQLDTGGYGRQAKPLYHLFVEQAKKLNPKYLIMITPSRWFSGGMGLDTFRKNMLHDRRISHLVDYTNSKDCFNGVSISGGVCYFLWEKDYEGFCHFTSNHNNVISTKDRYLDEFPIFVRHNKSIAIIRKIQKKGQDTLSTNVSSINMFGFPSSDRGANNKDKYSILLYHSQGTGYVSRKRCLNSDFINKFKVVVSRTISEHAGEPSKDGTYKVLAKMFILSHDEVCSHSYLVISTFDKETNALSLLAYLQTKFVRFLILQAISGIDLSKERFMFVPIQDFSKPWTDEELYKKYGLDENEIEFIESMIRPME